MRPREGVSSIVGGLWEATYLEADATRDQAFELMMVFPLSQESDRNIWDIIPINCWAKSCYFPCPTGHDNVVVCFQEYLGGCIAKAFQGGAVCVFLEFVVLCIPISVLCFYGAECR